MEIGDFDREEAAENLTVLDLEYRATTTTADQVLYGFLAHVLRQTPAPIRAIWVGQRFEAGRVILRSLHGIFYSRFPSIDHALVALGTRIQVARATQCIFINQEAAGLRTQNRRHQATFVAGNDLEEVHVSRTYAPAIRRYLRAHDAAAKSGRVHHGPR